MKMPCVDIPEGAMQFEMKPEIVIFNRSRHCPDFFWVLPPVPRIDYPLNCACVYLYPVIEGLIPGETKAFAEEYRKQVDPHGHFHLCACYGKVIE